MILELGDVASLRYVTFLGSLFNLAHLNRELPGGDFSLSDSGRLVSLSDSIRWNNVGSGCLTLVLTESDLPPLLTERDVRSWGPWGQFR
jgi:hypothetical protein